MSFKLFFAIQKYIAWSIIRRMLMIPQRFWWLINGTSFQIWRSKQVKNYDWCAHVLTVRLRHKFDLLLQPSGPENFVTTHHSFQHPKYILKDNVTLYYVTRNEAVFVETDPGVDVTHSVYGSFVRSAQFYNAKRIILMPIHAFHRIVEEIGDVKGTLVFVWNTGRCGSTLLSQIFEETGRSVAISEPDALNAIGAYKGKIPQQELDKLLINSVRALCKPLKRAVDFYALKPTAASLEAVPMFIRLFPKSKQVFMYREGLPVAKSFCKISTELHLFGLTFIMTKYSETLTKYTVDMMGLPSDLFKIKVTDNLAFGVYLWAAFVSRYLKFREQGIDIVGIKYDDLVEFPLPATQAIFKYCGIPISLADKAIGALHKDSQKLSPINMKNLSKKKTLELTPDRKVKTDAICDQFNLPRVPETCVLEGTITHVRDTVQNGKAS